jgi:hypothetical protein
MSLTSIIKAHPEIRSRIPNLKPNLRHLNEQRWSAEDWRTPIVVPSVGAANEASRIGTAIDYTIRVMLLHQAGNANTERGRLVAEDAFTVLPGALSNAEAILVFGKDPVIRTERLEGIRLARQHKDEMLFFIEEQLNSALAAIEDYVQTGTNLESLVQRMFFLSEMDFVYRVGSLTVLDVFLKYKTGRTYFSQHRTVSDEQLANNVVQLAKLFKKTFFKSSVSMGHVILNPMFGEFSGRVDGADADFVFDETLIDIKSTKNLGYTTESMAQIFGYAALSKAIGKPVERVGIYFARFGLFAIFPLSELESRDAFLDEYLSELLKAGESTHRLPGGAEVFRSDAEGNPLA